MFLQQYNKVSKLMRELLVAACLLPVALALGCDVGGPPAPDLPATATALAVDASTASAYKQLASTFVAGENAAATVGTGDFARIKPLLKVELRDGGKVTFAGRESTSVDLAVTNGDTAAHRVVIRLYDRNSPLSTVGYSIGALDVPGGGTASTKATSLLPFSSIAAQIQQIDKDVDFRPPSP
ncbi:MAG: hypothetical protein ACR2M0_15390 [Chloroflexia bacterium]